MTALPVVPAPAPNESLHSFIHRLAEHNLQRAGSIIDSRPGAPISLAPLVTITGLPEAALRALTWNGYPSSIVGRKGSTGWVLRKARWACLRCLSSTGTWHRSWELACIPVCLTCGYVLVSYPANSMEPQTAAQLDWFHHIWRRVAKAPTHKWVGAWFSRLLRVSRLLAVTTDEAWPQPTPPRIVSVLNRWGHHPPDDPEALAHLIPFVANLLGRRSESLMVAEAWQRYDTMPTNIAETLLPRRRRRRRHAQKQPAVHRASGSRELDRQRVKQLIRDLAGHDHATVPALIPDRPNQFLPSEERWPLAQEIALATVMLMNPRRSDRPGWFTEATRHLHLPPSKPAGWLERLELSGTIDTDKDHAIRQGLQQLGTNPLNYLERRHALIQLRRAPRIPTTHLDAPTARGWLWVYLTHGPIVITGPGWIPTHHAMPTRVIVEHHRHLPLEQRLLLAEFAERLGAELTGEDLAPWASPASITPTAEARASS